MGQVLCLGKDKYITVDRTFRDNGKEPIWAIIGGSKILSEPGLPARPVIFQSGKDFFYHDGSPVTELEDVDFLPQPYRALAEKFVLEGRAQPLKQFKAKEDAEVQASKRKPGRQKKPTKLVTEIKDAGSLLAVGGPAI